LAIFNRTICHKKLSTFDPACLSSYKKAIDKINQKLREDPKNKKLKKAKRDLEQDFMPREEKYEKYE